jgi:hypothetical protein
MPVCVGRSLHGRWAASLLRGCFGRYQNVLRIILIDGALRVTASKEAAPQGLYRLTPVRNLTPNYFMQGRYRMLDPRS